MAAWILASSETSVRDNAPTSTNTGSTLVVSIRQRVDVQRQTKHRQYQPFARTKSCASSAKTKVTHWEPLQTVTANKHKAAWMASRLIECVLPSLGGGRK